MATDTVTPTDSRVALVCGWFAAPPMIVVTTIWAVQGLTLEGSDRFQMLTVLLVFAGVGGLCLALAVLAVVFGRRAHQRLAVLLGAVTIGLIALCLLFLGIWILT